MNQTEDSYRALWHTTESLTVRLRSIADELNDDHHDLWGKEVLEASADRMDVLQQALEDAIAMIDHSNPGAYANGNTHPDGYGPDEGEVLASRELGRLKDILKWKEAS